MGRQPVILALELMLHAHANLQHQDVRGETARDRAVRDGFYASVDTIDRFVAAQANLQEANMF